MSPKGSQNRCQVPATVSFGVRVSFQACMFYLPCPGWNVVLKLHALNNLAMVSIAACRAFTSPAHMLSMTVLLTHSCSGAGLICDEAGAVVFDDICVMCITASESFSLLVSHMWYIEQLR
jgi:hypothetical protein